ncbi:Lrp/AsnC family transcriptional regulator [Archaeoglobus fulgidus]|uniref:Lrp/AsnC family transcriptional regulator n=1 Tax=Archaeoglobus fulgidus TaxID=2234 RepID=UPI00214DBF0B|nr:Lrp/AsnC family transcriptional regulator [Archaeoglobus fulgidus]
MKLDVELLMALQYELPLSTTPLVDLAEKLGRKPEDVMRAVREYIEQGVVKRYGLNLNYRAFSNYKRSCAGGF